MKFLYKSISSLERKAGYAHCVVAQQGDGIRLFGATQRIHFDLHVSEYERFKL